MPYVPETCPHCNRKLHGITTSEGPKFRCSPCGKLWSQDEYQMMLDAKTTAVEGPNAGAKPQ